MKCIALWLVVAFVMAVVVEGAKRKTTVELAGNLAKRRRIIVARDPDNANQVDNLFGDPTLTAIVPTRNQHNRHLKRVLPLEYDLKVQLRRLSRHLMTALRNGADGETALMRMRMAEVESYNLFSQYQQDNVEDRAGRVELDDWIMTAVKYIVPWLKVEDGETEVESVTRMQLVRHYDGVFYFSPLALFRFMANLGTDISWRFLPSVAAPVANNDVSRLESLPSELLLDIFNRVLTATPHTFHHLRLVCRRFYHINPLTSLYNQPTTDHKQLAKYIGLFIAGEPSVYLRHIHTPSLIYGRMGREEYGRFMAHFKYLMYDDSHGFVPVEDAQHRPLDHTLLANQLNGFSINDTGSVPFLIEKLGELAHRIRSKQGPLYMFLLINRTYIDYLLATCFRRFKKVPESLQKAIRTLIRSVSVFTAPCVMDVVLNNWSFKTCRGHIQSRGILDLTL